MSLEKYQQGSFRGAPFLIGDLDTSGGRKSVTHEFPGSDKRSVEDLGLLNDTFTISGLVKTDQDFTARDRLKAALSQEGSGALVHPTFGSLTAFAKSFTISERTGEIGIARLSMTFEVTQDRIFPAESAVKPSLIKNESDAAIDSIETDFSETFKASNPSNYDAAVDKLQAVGDKFNSISRRVSAISGDISEFTATVTTFVDGITQNITAPATLASSMKNMFIQLDQLAPSVVEQFSLAKQLFDFGGSDPVVEPNTFYRQERAENQNIINSNVSASALSLAYNNAANIDYGNELELQSVKEDLEEEYLRLIDDSNLSNDTIDQLTSLRNNVRLLFDDISVSVPKIRTIETATLPMSIISFQYYGTTDETDNLINLNSTLDVSYVSGSVDILTQ
jgi:prophage DNA circulation protein